MQSLKSKKITVQIPAGLLKKAQEATGRGITPTIRQGLELVAAGRAFEKVRELRGKVRFSVDWRSHKDIERKFYQDPRRIESYFIGCSPVG